MPAPSWKGYLWIGLATVPLRAYSASDAGPAISFNQLHSTGHSRIQYRKVCPIHGEVPKEEIVSGYEYAKGSTPLSSRRRSRETSAVLSW